MSKKVLRFKGTPSRMPRFQIIFYDTRGRDKKTSQRRDLGLEKVMYPYQPIPNLGVNFGWAEGFVSNHLRVNSHLLAKWPYTNKLL